MNTEAKCGCQHCAGHIGFERWQAGLTVPCPHCGADTTLYLPEEPNQEAPPPTTKLSSALIVWLVIGLCVLVAAFLAGVAGRRPKEVALSGQVFIVTTGAVNVPLGDVEICLLEKQDVLEFLGQKKQAIAEGMKARQLALNESRTELEKAKIELAARAAEERAFNESFAIFLQGGLTLSNADYQQARTNYGALLSELRDSERARLALLRKQILQAKAHTVNHFNNLSAQNQSLEDLRRNPLLTGPQRSGREGSSRNARAGALGFESLADTERAQLGELRRFLSVSETLGEDVAAVLDSIDTQVPLHAAFRTAREPRPAFLGAEELFLARANANLDSIIDRVRTIEDELLALKTEVKIKVMERRQAAQTRVKLAQGNLAAAELSIAGFPEDDWYFRGLSRRSLASVRTDAAGGFSLHYPLANALTLFARAERVTPEKTDRYFWLVDAPTNLPPSKLILSNSKLVSVDPDDYLDAKLK